MTERFLLNESIVTIIFPNFAPLTYSLLKTGTFVIDTLFYKYSAFLMSTYGVSNIVIGTDILAMKICNFHSTYIRAIEIRQSHKNNMSGFRSM